VQKIVSQTENIEIKINAMQKLQLMQD